MPSRFVSLAILIYWSIAAFCLLTWDVIPELALSYPPDLRAITVAGDLTRPVRWSIQVIDDARFPDVRRLVGEAVTASSRRPNGWFELTSRVEVDAGGLLKGTPLLSRSSIRLGVESLYRVEPTGNLHSFEIEVKSRESPATLIEVKGRLKGKKMEVVSRGPVPILNKTLVFDYPPRSVVHDVLGPLDRLPGLHVGQRWESQVINPFTGQVDRVRVEVKRLGLNYWNGDQVTTFEVVQQMASLSTLSMRTWVRTDGVILRQEVPLPFVRLVMERRPEGDDLPSLPQIRVPGS
jgi:hypothetical protein